MWKGGPVDSGSAGLCLPNIADTCTSREDMRSLTSSPISSPLSLGSLQLLFPTQTKYFTGKVRWREGRCGIHLLGHKRTGAHPAPPPPDFSLPGPNSLLLQDPGPLAGIHLPVLPFRSLHRSSPGLQCSSH